MSSKGEEGEEVVIVVGGDGGGEGGGGEVMVETPGSLAQASSLDSAFIVEVEKEQSAVPKKKHLLFDVLDREFINCPWIFMQFLDLPLLLGISATNKRFLELSRGNMEGNVTSYFECLYKKQFYYEEIFPLFWAAASCFDWLMRFKARSTTPMWIRTKDRKSGETTFVRHGDRPDSHHSPHSASELVMKRSMDLRLEAVLSGRFFFYPRFDCFNLDEEEDEEEEDEEERDFNYLCATSNLDFVEFVKKYRSTRGETHKYEPLADEEEEEEVEEDDEDDDDEDYFPDLWFDINQDLNPKFVKAVFCKRPFGYGDRSNSVCYWDATGTHIYHDYGFKMVSIPECGDMRNPPNEFSFGCIEASRCADKRVNINEREVWTMMLFYGYLGTVGCDIWDRELAAMRSKVSARGTLWSCDVCGTREGSVVISQCSRCKRSRYCSTSCQKKDWGKHKSLCTSPA